jgi:GDP-4-dehydro-6-deoxy-D-mannose reductase
MRVLVTGAAGFAGRHLLQELRAAFPGARLFGLVRRARPNLMPAGVTLLEADICSASAVSEAVRDAAPDQVYHLAGYASGAGGDREAIFRVNVRGTENVLAALEELGRPAALLVASTGYVYGPCDEARPAAEGHPMAPCGAYAESKAAMEERLRAHPAGCVRVMVARAFNHTGPGQSDAYAVPAFARQLAEIAAGRGAPVLETGNLESRRDFTDVRDVVRAYRLILSGGQHGECFNVCSGRATSMQEILGRLQSLAGTTVPTRADPARQRPSDVPVNVGSPRKLEERTGWHRKYTLTATLADVLADWRRREARELKPQMNTDEHR